MIKTNIKQNKNEISIDKNPQEGIKELEDGLDPSVLAKQILIKGENKRIFIDFTLKIRKSTIVNSKIEEELLKKYIFSAWKLRRMRELERRMLNEQQVIDSSFDRINFELGGKNIKRRIRNLSKIHINDDIKENNFEQERLEKQMAKAIRQLREEQKLNNRLVK